MKVKFTQKAPVDNIVSLQSLVMNSKCDQCAVGTGLRNWPGARCEKVVDWTWTSYTAAGQLLAGVPECAFQPYKTSRDQLRMPLPLFYAKHYAAALPRKSWQPYFDGSVVHWLDKRHEFFSGSFLNIAFIDKLRNNCSNSLAKWWSGRRAGGEIPAHIPEVIQKPFQCSILQLQKKWFWQYALCMALGL